MTIYMNAIFNTNGDAARAPGDAERLDEPSRRDPCVCDHLEPAEQGRHVGSVRGRGALKKKTQSNA